MVFRPWDEWRQIHRISIKSVKYVIQYTYRSSHFESVKYVSYGQTTGQASV